MTVSLHETCQQYFQRRLREGWKCIGLEGYHAVLLSPEGVRRELDLRNDVETLRPSANGDVIELTPSGDSPNYKCVDDVEPDEETTVCINPESGGNPVSRIDLYQVPAGGGQGNIEKVVVYRRGKSYSSGTCSINRGLIKTHDVVYEGGWVGFSSNWYVYDDTWTNNPNTSSPWTWAEIEALQIGVELRSCDSWNTRVTQVYVEVDYIIVVAPTVTTQACTNVQATTATGNGNIINTGGENCTRRGFCYKVGTTGDPTTADSVAYDDGSFGTGAYAKGITGLSPGTSYRVRAYAVNSVGTGYGTTVQILTKLLGRSYGFIIG